MRSASRLFRLLVATACSALVLAACSEDDDDGTGPEPALSAPTGLTATALSPTSVQVTWSQVSGAESYTIDRAQGGGEFSTLQSGLTATAHTDSGLRPGTEYRYRVRAVRGSEQSPNSAAASVTTPTEGPKIAILNGVTQDRTLHADTTYVLSGYVKVSNGATLTIQPGTKIVGDTLVPGSSLWILRGSKLVAEGTATDPIVFTSARPEGSRAPGDWGGIVIVGNAPINRTANPIFTEGPTGAAENYAGGNDFDDDSGSLRYVRIEFAGYDVSNGSGQELNGISMYAVGRGTTLEYVQTVEGLDDSFEWFGGAADGRYLVSFEAGDDHFDWSEGFQGRVQFALAVQTSVPTPRPGTGVVSGDPRGFEGDGCEADKAGCTYANTPYSTPVFANFTLIGPGPDVYATTDGNGVVIRRGSGGTFVNGIVARWPGVGFSIRDAESGALMDADSLFFRNIILAENGSNFEAPAGGRFGDRLQANAAAWSIGEAQLADLFTGSLPTSSTQITDANLGVQPAAGGPAATGGLASFDGTPIAPRVQDFFGGSMAATSYVGAVSPDGPPWYQGWTRWYRN